MTSKPWDSRLARFLIRPLQHRRVTPNHLTTLSLIAGLAAAVLYASGDPTAASWGAVLFMLAALLDHADGELARLTGKSTRFGHYYDNIAGAIIHIVLFLGIGLGMRHGPLGEWAVLLGITAGISISVIFALRLEIERRRGKDATQQPHFAGFEIEDILYLIGPITWFEGLPPFLIAAGLGAPVFALWTVWQYRRRPSPLDSAGRRP